MQKANADIRAMAHGAGVPLWQIAERLGCNDGNLSRKLRRELPDSQKARILEIIESLAQEKKEAEHEIDGGKVGA